MEIGNSVGTHQPDEAVTRVAAEQLADGVDREVRAGARFKAARADRSPPRHRSGGIEPRLERRHLLAGLERVAGRDQPPDLVEAEGVDGGKADPAMPAVRGIERAAEKS